MRSTYRHTKIVFTIGPATDTDEVLEQLITLGVDICRLNMAHASHEWTRKTIRKVREVCSRVERDIAFMMDVKGPEIRTGDVKETVELQRGDTLYFITHQTKIPADHEAHSKGVTVNYPGMSEDVNVGQIVLVDSGLIRLKITALHEFGIETEVITPGPLGSRRHINLPGVHVRLPALTEKDQDDIRIGIEEGVEFYALSFVREANDLDILRRYLTSLNSQARIIAKIEDQSAISNLDEIIEAADALMVARGDLGIEIPYEELPIVQRNAVRKCLTVGKPVIIATHMLESMIEAPMPTRAEITDVANAVLEQADCVMLSGETTVGKYPIECVSVLNRIITKIEMEEGPDQNDKLRIKTSKGKMLRAATILAEQLNGAAILVFTRSGYLAQVLSALRSRRSPVYAFTDSPLVYRQMLIMWGIEPFLMEFTDNPETTIREAMITLKKKNWVQDKDQLVVITNVLAGEKIIDSIQLRRVE